MLCEGCGNPVIDGTCFCGGQAVKELKERLALAEQIIRWHEDRHNYCAEECVLIFNSGKTFADAGWLEEYKRGEYTIQHNEMCKKIQKFLEG